MDNIPVRAPGQDTPERAATTNPPRRLNPTTQTRIQVWAAAAGRCTFCNRLVTEASDLGIEVLIGELAHIVGWGPDSPRGAAPLDEEDRRSAENLILACRNCHKPIDDGGVVGLYFVERLKGIKRDHETRIRRLTDIGADRTTHVVRVVGAVRGTNPELTRATVLDAVTSVGLYPQILPNAHWEDIDLDLRNYGPLEGPADFLGQLPAIENLAARINDGVRRDAITRVAVFAVARIPLLVYLGARLDDKVRVLPFQRHRTDSYNPWIWPCRDDPADFVLERVRNGSDPNRVALVLSLSGKIHPEELPASVDSSYAVYEIGPKAPAEIGPGLIAHPSTLANFQRSLRRFLGMVEEMHGKISNIPLFPAVPVSAAIEIGRTLMPTLSPSWRVFDRIDRSEFIEMMEVAK